MDINVDRMLGCQGWNKCKPPVATIIGGRGMTNSLNLLLFYVVHNEWTWVNPFFIKIDLFKLYDCQTSWIVHVYIKHRELGCSVWMSFHVDFITISHIDSIIIQMVYWIYTGCPMNVVILSDPRSTICQSEVSGLILTKQTCSQFIFHHWSVS